MTAFNANCSLSHPIFGGLGGWGFFFVSCMALVTALPGLAHELLLRNPLFDFCFYTVVWHK